jgi:hypothetical protein
VKGKTADSGSVNQTSGTHVTLDANGPLDMYLDVDKMNLRLDSTGYSKTDGMNITATAGSIISVADKKITLYYNATNPFSPSEPLVNCTSWVINQMPSADLLRSLIKTELGQQAVTKDPHTGFNKIEHTLDASILPINPQPHGNILFAVEMDADSVLQKAQIVGNLTQPASIDANAIYTSSKDSTKAGTPDAKWFTVPAEWGPCHEGKPPGLPLKSGIPALEHFEIMFNVIEQYIRSKAEAQSDSLII